jgi:hypothetical protein
MKPILSINKGDIANRGQTLGMTEFLNYLVHSGEFDIKEHREGLGIEGGYRGTIVYVNGKKVFIDFWEYAIPAFTMRAYKSNFDLVIKLQYRSMPCEQFNAACKRKKFLYELTDEQRCEYFNKFVPWTFFPSRMMKQFIGKEDELEQLPIEQFAFFCGKSWKGRRDTWKKAVESGIQCTASSQELPNGVPLSDEDYIYKMRTSKYGLVIHGRTSAVTDAKNRREIDYMILKKPILMDYKPTYYNPLIDGKHFIFIDKNTDLNGLEQKHDIKQIALNAYEWYKNNASEKGVVKSFLQIMTDKKIV